MKSECCTKLNEDLIIYFCVIDWFCQTLINGILAVSVTVIINSTIFATNTVTAVYT